jgi:hypothetical protein
VINERASGDRNLHVEQRPMMIQPKLLQWHAHIDEQDVGRRSVYACDQNPVVGRPRALVEKAMLPSGRARPVHRFEVARRLLGGVRPAAEPVD